jgi:hypothetical protein
MAAGALVVEMGCFVVMSVSWMFWLTSADAPRGRAPS